MGSVMGSGLSHLTQNTNILLDLSVTGLPTLNALLIAHLMSIHAVRITIAINVMEATAPFTSSVSILNLVKNVNKTQIVTTGMELAMYLLPMTLTTVPTVLKKELALEDVEVWTMT